MLEGTIGSRTRCCFVKEKIELEQHLQDITESLEESKNYISQLQIQTKKEKRDRAK